MTVAREPTHSIRRSTARHPVVVAELGAGERDVQLTDLLVRNLERAHEAVARAEADIARWLDRTGQGTIPADVW